MKYILLTFLIVIFQSVFCSDPVEMSALFRGDSPLYFNKTNIVMNETEVTPLTLKLQKEPTSDVAIDLTVSDDSEIQLDPSHIVFTPQNYATPQTINVIGIDDCLSDGTQPVTISTSSISSNDTSFNNGPAVSLSVTMDDSPDNLPRIIFYQNSDMITSELGTIAFFTAKLSCAPTADVTVPLVIDQPAEVSTDKTQLVFTPTDYSTSQTVTVTGLSDCVLDADKPYTIQSGNVISTDNRFDRYGSAAGSSQIHAVVAGTNLNYSVTNDTNIVLPTGSMDMALLWNAGVPAHPDPFVGFSVALTCPVTNPVYFSFGFKNNPLSVNPLVNEKQFISTGSAGTVFTSPYGYTWVAPTVAAPTANQLNKIAWNGKVFIAVGASNTILTSTDGTSWNTASSVPAGVQNLNGVAWNGSVFVAIGTAGTVLTSSDGTTWTVGITPTGSPDLFDIVWAGSQFVVVGASGNIFTSPDASSWTIRTSGTINALNSIVWNNSGFVAVGATGTVLTSTDASVWTLIPSISANSLNSVAWSGSQFITVGATGTIFSSTDGTNWLGPKTSGTTSNLNGVTWDNQFIAVGDSGTILKSTDGNTWNSATLPATTQNLMDVYPGSFARVTNTTYGNSFLTFDSNNWALPQSVLIQLTPEATEAYFKGMFPGIIPTFTDKLTHQITVYQSQGDNQNTPISSPSYATKTLYTNITISGY